jgi:hypothetical protein
MEIRDEILLRSIVEDGWLEGVSEPSSSSHYQPKTEEQQRTSSQLVNSAP